MQRLARSVVASTLAALAFAPAALAGVPCYSLSGGDYQCVAKLDGKSPLVVTVDRATTPPSASVEGALASGKLLNCKTEAPAIVQVFSAAIDQKHTVAVRFDKTGKQCLSAKPLDLAKLAQR